MKLPSHTYVAAVVAVLACSSAQAQPVSRPFGTLREQAAMQQEWLKKRLDTFLPALMRKHGVDMWVVPMREYNEDPMFTAIAAPETFAARRRTIYVFFDTCAGAGASAAAATACVERIALGGTSQGGVFEARRSTKKAAGDVGRGQQAELWGDEQWQALKAVIEERNPKAIAIDRSTVFAFSDGLSSGELQGMTAALGDKWTSKFRNADGLPLDLLASRLPEEEGFYRRMQELVWSMTREMFSPAVIKVGQSRTSDLVWWWRQRVNDLGLGTWFQPSIDVQRKGVTAAQLGDDPVIQPGDVLHCDVGITVARLNTDTQHLAYVLRPGESDAPAGLKRALANANALQDIVMDELRPGRTGNEILAASLARMKAKRIDGTVYSHPIGLHGHGAGPLIGLWDYQDGVAGRGDAKVIPSMWWSIELQATTPVPEWGGQPVRMAQEEDAVIGADGKIHWALRRQDALFLVGSQATSSSTSHSAIDELIATDRAFSAAAAKAVDLVSALSPMFDDEVIVQVPGNKFVNGKAAVIEYLRASTEAGAHVEWAPIRGGISADAMHGFTFGFMTVTRPDGTRVPAKYMTYWTKGPDGWRAAVYKSRPRAEGDVKQDMMAPAVPARFVAPATDAPAIARFRESLDHAERSFSRDAQTIGLGAAFTQYGSDDAVNMGGPNVADYAVGAEAIGRRIGANSPPGPSPISWAPDKVIVASSGDLGVTIGWIRPNKPSPDRPAALPFFTIWRRATPDAPWKYVAE